ncbi:hypothetical protein TrLO_g12530, partial [Triparma laevis f. longispina]
MENAAKIHPATSFEVHIPLNPTMHLTTSTENVKHVLITKFDNYPKGPLWRDNFADLLGEGIFNADGVAWKKQRKVASYEFSAKTLRTFMYDVFAKHSQQALSVMKTEKAASSSELVDCQEVFARYTLESIGVIGFGCSLGAFKDANVSASFGDAFNLATLHTADRFVDPIWKLKRLLQIGSEKKLSAAIRQIQSFCSKVIAERHQDKNLDEKADLLSRFMSMSKNSTSDVNRISSRGEEGGGELEFSDKELYYIIINFVLAGRDTTANSLTWTLWELSKEKNKGCVDKIREENRELRKDAGAGGEG